MSASAGRGKLDCCFVLLIAYLPMELFLAWVLALWAAASCDGRFGAHSLLASIAHHEFWIWLLDLRNALLCPFVWGWRQLISWLCFTGVNKISIVSIFSRTDTQETNFYSGIN